MFARRLEDDDFVGVELVFERRIAGVERELERAVRVFLRLRFVSVLAHLVHLGRYRGRNRSGMPRPATVHGYRSHTGSELTSRSVVLNTFDAGTLVLLTASGGNPIHSPIRRSEYLVIRGERLVTAYGRLDTDTSISIDTTAPVERDETTDSAQIRRLGRLAHSFVPESCTSDPIR